MEKLDTELAKKLHHALTASQDEIFQVMTDVSPEVLRTVLKNPAMGEEHLLVLLKRRDLPEELLKDISRMPAVVESHRLKIALVHHPNTPPQIFLNLLQNLHLFELAAVCLLPGIGPDRKVAAERAVMQRLPVTPLGNKLTLARRGTSSVVASLLKEGEPALMEACLSNPRLRESDIYLFLDSPNATSAAISAIARHPRWQQRPNLRLAILRNHKTPQVWLTVFLPKLPTIEARNLLNSGRLTEPWKKEIKEELKRRGN